MTFCQSRDSRAKLVVWAHNSHLGDTRATQLGRQGELNLGQLVRERYGLESVLIGFTTLCGHDHGSVELGWRGRPETRAAGVAHHL